MKKNILRIKKRKKDVFVFRNEDYEISRGKLIPDARVYTFKGEKS